METKSVEAQPLPEQGIIECSETPPRAKTNLVEMNREEIGMVVRNWLKLMSEIDQRNSN